jgi:bacteriophage exclusion system BrxA-like protein
LSTDFELADMVELRDRGPYSARNSSKGALIEETSRVVAALNSGIPLEMVRQQVHDGDILTQRSWSNRRRIWTSVQQRYLQSSPEWIVGWLRRALDAGSQSREFITALYVLYSLKDKLTFDFVTTTLWSKGYQNQPVVSRNDVLDLLEQASTTQPQIRRWSESTRIKLAGSILTALRDFGLLEGKQKKVLVRPVLPLLTAEFLLRLLVAEGSAGKQILEDPTWRLFLLSPTDVSAALGKLAQSHVIRFERAGTTIVLEVPPDWERPR